MTEPLINSLLRRDFLAWGSRSFATFLLGVNGGLNSQALSAAEKPATTFLFDNATNLGELLPPDNNGLRLPAGFKSRVIARSSKTVLDTAPYIWHNAPDGGACFASEDGGWVYVSNSEVKIVNGGGGVGAVRFNAQGEIVDAYSILAATDNNCAGGKTPWQTWLSCEEVERGLVYECDPFGQQPAVARHSLGRFKHEAVAIDPVFSHLYLTEDEPNGGLYRFVPSNALPDLNEGTLQIAQVVHNAGQMTVTWLDLPDHLAIITPTRYQLLASAKFNGGEGITWHDGAVYFTTKGDNRVWRYDTHAAQLAIIYDAATSTMPHLSGVDNVTITASGDVLVAEDGGDMQIVLLGPDGLVLPVVQITGQDESEICGPAFDPSFQRLYFSSQTGPSNSDADGIVYEISRVFS
ncbi:MAG: alkaline phosphatase PhoX [Pseudomonadota bacterium]